MPIGSQLTLLKRPSTKTLKKHLFLKIMFLILTYPLRWHSLKMSHPNRLTAATCFTSKVFTTITLSPFYYRFTPLTST